MRAARPTALVRPLCAGGRDRPRPSPTPTRPSLLPLPTPDLPYLSLSPPWFSPISDGGSTAPSSRSRRRAPSTTRCVALALPSGSSCSLLSPRGPLRGRAADTSRARRPSTTSSRRFALPCSNPTSTLSSYRPCGLPFGATSVLAPVSELPFSAPLADLDPAPLPSRSPSSRSSPSSRPSPQPTRQRLKRRTRSSRRPSSTSSCSSSTAAPARTAPASARAATARAGSLSPRRASRTS